MKKLTLEFLSIAFSVCKLPQEITPPTGHWCFTGRTDTENSLVCPTESVPKEAIAREDGWCGFRIVGTLDFSLIGILSAVSSCLADAGVGIFALSTFDTDSVLLKKDNKMKAVAALRNSGFDIVGI